jgi:hypothetical protein
MCDLMGECTCSAMWTVCKKVENMRLGDQGCLWMAFTCYSHLAFMDIY